MREADWQRFASELLRDGISPRHVQRTVCELREHREDLVSAAIEAGRSPAEADQQAAQQMGDLQDVAVALRACPELRSWSYRYPRLAVVVYPLTCLLLLPAMPVFAGVAHASQLARWAACVLLGGFVTAFIFLLLQLSIALT